MEYVTKTMVSMTFRTCTRRTAKIRPKGALAGSRSSPQTAGLASSGAGRREGSLGWVTGRGEPSWQPISMLPTIASLIDEGLRDAREHYATLLEARPKAYVLDDATIARTKRVNREGLELRRDGSEEELLLPHRPDGLFAKPRTSGHV